MGYNTYFYSKSREIETLMNQKDFFTIWYTLSTADNHWVDLHNFLYGNKPMPNLSDSIKNV